MSNDLARQVPSSSSAALPAKLRPFKTKLRGSTAAVTLHGASLMHVFSSEDLVQRILLPFCDSATVLKLLASCRGWRGELQLLTKLLIRGANQAFAEDATSEGLSALLSHMASLVELQLDLTQQELSLAANTCLAQSLGSLVGLKRLVFRARAWISLDGGKLSTWSRALPQLAPTLEILEIDLSVNSLPPLTMSVLAFGLESCRKLQELTLKVDINPIRDNGLECLLQAVLALPALRNLTMDLAACRISERGCFGLEEHFLTALEESQAKGSPGHDGGGGGLVESEAAKRQGFLEQVNLDLRGNPLTRRGRAVLTKLQGALQAHGCRCSIVC